MVSTIPFTKKVCSLYNEGLDMTEEDQKTDRQSTFVVIRKRASEVWWILPMICSATALCVGAYLFFHLPNKINEANHDNLLSRIETIGVLTNAADIAALPGTKEDLANDVYGRIKENLYNIHNVSTGARLVYYMRSNAANDFIFLADSETPGSEYNSLPGTINRKISPFEANNFLNAVSFTEGPYSDEMGTWVSGYSPIWYQGKLVGIVGMDLDASKWVLELKDYRRNILVITLLVAFVFLLFGLHIRRLIFSYSTRA